MANVDTVKLQLAMAFGQGAGTMLANAEALETLLAEHGAILGSALTNWSASHWAFTELVRTLGQLSAARAAASGSPEIRWSDIEPSIAAVMEICPCISPGAPLGQRNPGR
jgi:hypothetical protein